MSWDLIGSVDDFVLGLIPEPVRNFFNRWGQWGTVAAHFCILFIATGLGRIVYWLNHNAGVWFGVIVLLWYLIREVYQAQMKERVAPSEYFFDFLGALLGAWVGFQLFFTVLG